MWAVLVEQVVEIDEERLEVFNFLNVLFRGISYGQSAIEESGEEKCTSSGLMLMTPTNSRNFKSNDFAIRLSINARSWCLSLPFGVLGGVYNCSIPTSCSVGNGASSYHIPKIISIHTTPSMNHYHDMLCRARATYPKWIPKTSVMSICGRLRRL